MTIQKLIERLNQFPSDMEVKILDGFNGGGVPRTINLGPYTQTITSDDAKDAIDCEDLEGEEVVIIGYGCY